MIYLSTSRLFFFQTAGFNFPIPVYRNDFPIAEHRTLKPDKAV
ncbi:hypothetical protein TW90_0806 [Neisseria flavescens]|nr:hypothetical protein TW90_0806 [Neisseria flavescens]